MPLWRAVALDLKPRTATNVEQADGSVSAKPVADGVAIIQNRRVLGPIILEEASNDILLGTDFLRTFKMMLIRGSKHVVLIHEDELYADFAKMSQRLQLDITRSLPVPKSGSEP